MPAGVDRFEDEHIIPLSLGGNLILPEASCRRCAGIINREIENPVSRIEWGYFRAKFKLPTRDKKRRKTHIDLRRVDGTPMRVPIEDYSAPVPPYKFGTARILAGIAPGSDHLRWTAAILGSHDEEMEMQRKFPESDKRHTIKAQPHEFARLLAKIAHGYATAEYGLGAYTPLVIDIILGDSDDYFYAVGGTWDIPPAVPGWNHITDIRIEFRYGHALVIVEIRLFPSAETPSYHVVVGAIDSENPVHLRAFEKHRLEGRIIKGPLKVGSSLHSKPS